MRSTRSSPRWERWSSSGGADRREHARARRDLEDLVDAPPETVKTPIDRLAEAGELAVNARGFSRRIGDSQLDDPGAGVYHVGVAEPLWIEMVIDTT